jgi:hypothetical protein
MAHHLRAGWASQSAQAGKARYDILIRLSGNPERGSRARPLWMRENPRMSLIRAPSPREILTLQISVS